MKNKVTKKLTRRIIGYTINFLIIIFAIVSFSRQLENITTVEVGALLDYKSPTLEKNYIEKSNELLHNENHLGDFLYKRYYYYQLNNAGKKLYNGIANSAQYLVSGKYEIQYANSFKDIISHPGGTERLGSYYQSAIEAFSYDNPEIYYVNYNKLNLNIKTTTTKITFSTEVTVTPKDELRSYYPNYIQNAKQIEEYNQQLEQLTKGLLSMKKPKDDFYNVKLVHDYLVDTIDYDTEGKYDYRYDIIGGLIKKQAVCEGYAKSFKYLMDKFEIPCVIVLGKAQNSNGQTEDHAWNYVNVGGMWKAIDVTWDDPITEDGQDVPHERKYKYFLRYKEQFNDTHFPEKTFSENGMEFKYPI